MRTRRAIHRTDNRLLCHQHPGIKIDRRVLRRMPNEDCHTPTTRAENRLAERFADEPDCLKRIVDTPPIGKLADLSNRVCFSSVHGMRRTELFAQFQLVVQHIDSDERFRA